MNKHFLANLATLSLKLLLPAIILAAPISTINAQKSLNSSHQMEARADLPKVKKTSKNKGEEEKQDYKAAGQAATVVRRQAAAEAAAKAAAEAKAAEEARIEAERKAAMAAGTYVDSTIYDLPEINVELSLYDQAPTFPGGMSGLAQFISDNLKYPKACEQQQIEGRVTCQLIISAEGKIIGVSVVRGVHPALDTEAVRIVKSMPAWQPARLDGVPVNCKYNLPLFLSYRG